MRLDMIKPEDLVAGDIIMIRLGDDELITEASVCGLKEVDYADSKQLHFVDNEDPVTCLWDWVDSVDVWLVHRPKKLPTKLGSVVKVGDRTFVLAEERARCWYSIDSGIWYDPESIEDMTEGWELVE